MDDFGLPMAFGKQKPAPPPAQTHALPPKPQPQTQQQQQHASSCSSGAPRGAAPTRGPRGLVGRGRASRRRVRAGGASGREEGDAERAEVMTMTHQAQWQDEGSGGGAKVESHPGHGLEDGAVGSMRRRKSPPRDGGGGMGRGGGGGRGGSRGGDRGWGGSRGGRGGSGRGGDAEGGARGMFKESFCQDPWKHLLKA